MPKSMRSAIKAARSQRSKSIWSRRFRKNLRPLITIIGFCLIVAMATLPQLRSAHQQNDPQKLASASELVHFSRTTSWPVAEFYGSRRTGHGTSPAASRRILPMEVGRRTQRHPGNVPDEFKVGPCNG